MLAQSLGLTRFLHLMARFTVPEELLGSISIQGMKQDNYRRITTNRMPEAQIVVLDEPFKASSAILNVMLSIINERVFDNGGTRIDVPMISLYGASNELPQSLDLLRAHAVLEQRPAVDPDDLQILKHGFWNTHEQRATIAQLVAALANPINVSAFELADQAQSVYEGVMAAQRSGDPNLSSSKVIIEGNDKLREIRKRLRQQPKNQSIHYPMPETVNPAQ